MPEFGYSMQLPKDYETKFAKAQLHDVDASYKDLGQVCANIKGLSVEKAESLLAKVSKGEFPIWFKKHNKKMGHRGEIGGKKGRYPIKCAKIVLQVLKNAVANANNKGLLGELKVVHAAANKQGTYPRVAPRGRWRRSNYVTSRVEIILKEIAEAKPEEKAKKREALTKKAAEKRKAREEAEKAAIEATKAAGESEPAKQAAPVSAEEKKAEKALERTSMEQG
jgi:large subunit ribosomal protein L22